MNSFVQVYTGNGKGKTTAAIGLAIRAAGANKQVFIAQFVKGMHYSELEVLPTIKNISLKQYGRGCFIYKKPTDEDVQAARQGLQEIDEILGAGHYDLVILDEACIALYFKLFTFDELKIILEKRNPHTEVIITGRYAPDELIEYADLVTEMKEVKHYYTRGIEARAGIEK